MPDITDCLTMENFLGVNNVDAATCLEPVAVVIGGNKDKAFQLPSASNLDIDNIYGIETRPGYTAALSGTDIHSLWSDNVTCLYVDGAILYQLKTDYSKLSLRSSLTVSARMSYAPVNTHVYYTNGYEIGYVESLASVLLSDPELEFKTPLPAGQLIEYYKGRLYVAADSVLYISDPLCDYFDVRTGYILFDSRITLLRALDDGIFVGDDNIWWLKGDAPDEFQKTNSYVSRAIPFTDVRVPAQHVDDSLKGNLAIWTSENGICMGDNSGQVVSLTEARYNLTPTGQGSGFIRDLGNIRHYINTLY